MNPINSKELGEALACIIKLSFLLSKQYLLSLHSVRDTVLDLVGDRGQWSWIVGRIQGWDTPQAVHSLGGMSAQRTTV